MSLSIFASSFEQEVLGGPVSGSPAVIEAVPVALAVPAVPVVRPIIGTNTYRQVCTKYSRNTVESGEIYR